MGYALLIIVLLLLSGLPLLHPLTFLAGMFLVAVPSAYEDKRWMYPWGLLFFIPGCYLVVIGILRMIAWYVGA